MKTIGVWRAQPLPRGLDYASPGAARARSRSGFGVTSLITGCLLALAVTAGAAYAVPWTAEDGDWIALSALPVCFIGAAFGIVGSVRPSKRRLPGILGVLINLFVAVGVALLWIVTHVVR